MLFALGPCGKVLAYTMLQQGYRVIDIGHAIQDYNAYKNRVVMDSAGIAQFFDPDLWFYMQHSNVTIKVFYTIS